MKSLIYTNSTGYGLTGSYNSSLPTLPFYNVNQGRNHVYKANYGYNLVAGWGSIDAYNLTMYVLNVNYKGIYGALQGVENIFNLTGLNVTSYYINGTVDRNYNASIQQNFFVANSLGAPIYWIQNVIYINGSQRTGWFMSYTGWVVYPFYGLYPNEAIYEYNFPTGKIVTLPHTFVIKSWLSNLNATMDQKMNFEVNDHILQLPVPGASFIIGSYNYSYMWQGKVYKNGPYPGNANPGGLSPQFGLVGGPSGGIGNFTYPTGGSMKSYVLPVGLNQYIIPDTYTFTNSNDQTGESSDNLNWVNQNGTWHLSIIPRSNIQGVISVEPNSYLYNITFIESGLPSGTLWYVNLSNGQSFSSSVPSLTFQEPNGTYSYTIGSISGYSSSPSSGSITVNGKNITQSITFTPLKTTVTKYSVTFTESGLPSGTSWSVTLNGTTLSSSNSTISFYEPNGTYSYTIGSISGYSSSPSSGLVTISGLSQTIAIRFLQVKYNVTFTEAGLSKGSTWYVNLSNGQSFLVTGTSVTFSEPNGTYSYTIATNNKDYAPSKYFGTFIVNGTPVSEFINFVLVTYKITFTESGLPSGTSWSVTLNGTTLSSSN
ncbi:MAG: hypothetical protein ACP5MB_11100, partial [bacterium]